MRRAIAVAAGLLAVGLFLNQGGPTALARLAPSFDPTGEQTVSDFYQFWAAARDWRAGGSLYEDLAATYPTHEPALGRAAGLAPDRVLPTNAYPPFATLVFLPFSYLNYADALLAWRYLTAAAVTAAVILLSLALVPGPRAGRLAVVVAGTVFVFGGSPIKHDIVFGNVGGVLLLTLTLAWLAEGCGRTWAAGGLTAVATAFKLFPGLLVVHFAAADRPTFRRTLVGLLAVTAVTVAIFGVWEHVLFSKAVKASETWYAKPGNHSLHGFWFRLLTRYESPIRVSEGEIAVEPLAENRNLAKAAALGTSALVLAPFAWMLVRPGRWDRRRRDLAFAAAVLAMLLASPVTWAGTLLLAVLPIFLLAHHGGGRPVIAAVIAVAAAVLWYHPALWEWRFRPAGGGPYRTNEVLTHLAFKTYALILLYGVALVGALRQPPAEFPAHQEHARA